MDDEKYFFFCYSLSPFTIWPIRYLCGRLVFFLFFFSLRAARLRGTFLGHPRPLSLLLFPSWTTQHNIHGRPIRPGIRTLLTSRWCRKSAALPSTTLPSAPERHTHTSMARRRFLHGPAEVPSLEKILPLW
jgi:hypothetical protein